MFDEGQTEYKLDLVGDHTKVLVNRNFSTKKFRPLCYIAGPMLSEGNPYVNIGDAIELSDTVWERGWAPVIPHLDFLVTMVLGEHDIKRLLTVDSAILSRCSAVCVLPFKIEKNPDGTTTGTAFELDLAEELNIPVYTEETLPYVS